MKVISITSSALPSRLLVIGYVGENERTQVRIDCTAILTEYPHASPTLAIKPPVGAVYPVVVSREDNEVVWNVSNADLQNEGDGELQLTFTKDGVVAKTVIGKLRISRSLLVTGEQPDVIQTWYDAATEKLAEVDAQIVELEGMVDTATDAATRAEQSESNATTAAANAATSAATATAKATEATTAAGTATAKAAEAALSATQASNSAVSAADSERGAIAKAAEAAQSAQTATTKAGQATEAAQTATGKAEEASASATAAQTSATNAASSATAAQAAQTAAQASETAASASATQAAQSAQTASTAAQTATQKAADASASATDAATSATNAATNAETASTKAGEAAQSAQAVEETAEQLAESLEQISQNTADIAEHEQYAEATYAKKTDLSNLTSDLDLVQASGNIVETDDAFPTFAEDVTAEINHVQDLHGYDHPWPAGGGKNLIDAQNVSCPSQVNNQYNIADYITLPVGTYTLSFTVSKAVTGTRNRPLYSAQSAVYCNEDFYTAGRKSWTFTLSEETTLQFKWWGHTLSADCTISDFMLESGSTATDYAPFSNICPISGFDSVKVVRTGKNLSSVNELADHGPLWGSDQSPIKAMINSLPVGTYTLSNRYEILEMPSSGKVEHGAIYVTAMINGKQQPVNRYTTVTDSSPSLGKVYEEQTVITITEENKGKINHTYTYCDQTPTHTGTGRGRYRVFDIQIELGSTATAYEPYNGIQVELPFGRTVYGGTIDLTTGKLTVDKASVDLGSLSWSYGADFCSTESMIQVAKHPASNTDRPNFISSIYVVKALWDDGFSTSDSVITMTGNGQIRIRDSRITDLQSIATAISGQTLVYELATPEVYTLTPAQLLLLREYNAVWANTGDIINFEYRAGEFVTKKEYDALKEAMMIHSTASGSIASFSDGAEMPVDEVTAQINPVQDLHGYDHPWPGGGNKNLLQPNVVIPTTIAGGVNVTLVDGVYVFNGTATSGVNFNLDNWLPTPGNPIPHSAETLNLCISAQAENVPTRQYAYLQSGYFLNGTPRQWTVSFGSSCLLSIEVEEDDVVYTRTYINILSGITYNNFRVKVQVEIGDTATEWTPYSNICPITGWDGVKVTRTGKNLLQGFERYNVTNYVSSPIFLKAGEQYTVSFESDIVPSAIYLRKGAFNTDAEQYKYNSRQWTFAPNESRMYLFQFYKGATGWDEHTFSNLQLELGSTVTDYEPYQGETYDIAFPSDAGTVYGGSLTIAEDGSGVLTVNRAMVGMGSMVWNYNTTYAFFTSNSISTRKIGVLNVWSDLFKTMAGSWSGTPVQNALWGNGSNTTLYVQIPPLDNVDDFMALVDGHQLMYELATPLTYTLTAAQITTLLGENNLWHDANGDISVGYKANTKLYVDNKITQAIAAALNS